MKMLICPDSFKNSLTSREICEVLLSEIKRINPAADLVSIPMADGGEGTLDVLYSLGGYERIAMNCLDPLRRPIDTYYLVERDMQTVIIEMAQASGIERLSLSERNCMYTSTYGTGLQIRHAINTYHPKRIYLTVGSSSTNEAGLGMLAAMGCTVIDEKGSSFEFPTGADLINVSKIITGKTFRDLVAGIDFVIINDVNNTFSGAKGAAHTYAKQKGASPDEILILDRGLQVVRDVINHDLGINLDEIQGAGAAGGIAGGAYAYLGANMISGTSFLSLVTNLESAVDNADLVITGEGRLDHQTLQGKLVYHIAQLCNSRDKPMIVICGANDMSDVGLDQLGNPKVYALNDYNSGEYTDATTRRDLKIVVKDILNNL